VGFSNYAADPADSRESKDKKRKIKVYTNLTSPTDQPERVTVDVSRKNVFNLSYPTAYSSSSKGGYVCSVKMEDISRLTDEQGIMYDNGAFVELKFGASDGTNRAGVLLNGADWLALFHRLEAFIEASTLDLSDDAITVNQSSQPVIDKMMHMVADLGETVTETA
jgi:hypothetical protein